MLFQHHLFIATCIITSYFDNFLYMVETLEPYRATRSTCDIWAATWQNQQSDCAPSEDSDQPGHPPSPIRVFAVRSKGS